MLLDLEARGGKTNAERQQKYRNIKKKEAERLTLKRALKLIREFEKQIKQKEKTK